jgi:hypothetical protein
MRAIQAAVTKLRVAKKNITKIMVLRNHGWFKNFSCSFEISMGRKRPPKLIKKIATASEYGELAIFVKVASKGPLGGGIAGGGPEKLI